MVLKIYGFRCTKGFDWLVDFGFNSPLRQYFSLYRAVSQREGEPYKGKINGFGCLNI